MIVRIARLLVILGLCAVGMMQAAPSASAYTPQQIAKAKALMALEKRHNELVKAERYHEVVPIVEKMLEGIGQLLGTRHKDYIQTKLLVSQAYSNRGIAWAREGNNDRAMADYNHAIGVNPKNSFAYNNRANAWKDKGDYDRAIADYDEAIRIEPKYSGAYYGRGNAWNKKQEYDRGLKDFNHALQLDPKNSLHYNGRANAWIGKGDLDRAMADFNESIRIDPKHADAYSNRGDAWKNKGEFDIALADFNEAIRLNPKSATYYAGRAGAWSEKRDYDRAMADCTEAIRIDPKSSLIYNNCALLLRDLRDFDRAITYFSEAIRLDPTFDKPYSNRGEIWRLKGDLDRALADQDQAIRLKADNTTNYVLRGDTLRYKGDLDRAIAEYDQALRIKSDNVAAFTGRGLTYEKMGDAGRARADFENAVASPSLYKSGIFRSALDTARARLAALDSGAPQPIIMHAPSKASSSGSIPTPVAAIPSVAPSAIKQGRRIALVISNSAYKNVAALANPQRDGEAIAASLRSIGFESVMVANDSTREKLIEALRAFANDAETADWAMVYYAGHGIEVNGMNYLIPVEAKLAADRDVQFETVPLDQVMVAVEGAKKLKLILIDACRDNPFAPQMRRTTAPEMVAAAGSTGGGAIGTRSIGRGLGEVRVSGATLVVYAAKHGQVALDGEGGNSPFAVAVVQRIATPNVEINKLFRLVRDDVMEATAGRQEPFTYGSLPGREDFFFVAK